MDEHGGGKSIETLNGYDLKLMIAAALSCLHQHQAEINALNVFPVPDGDTGTNMTLTMTSAWNEIANVEEDNIGRLASKAAHGALMGARGNSGVILSQILRGFARGLDSRAQMRAADMPLAMHEAKETAYKGVVKPVEGTILTVVREVAEEAAAAARETDDLQCMFERLVERARSAVARTPQLLPVLRQAGVVDSGGQGFLVVLEGMLRHIKGLPMEDFTYFGEGVEQPAAAFHDMAAEALFFDDHYPYDVQFIVAGDNMNVAEVRTTIEAMGDSALIVGDPHTIKVHVHVLDPGIPISYGAKCGSLQDVVVEDMRVQYRAFVAGREATATATPASGVPLFVPTEEAPRIGVVVVAAGDGLARVFRSLGATGVVDGGQTMNPSTAQILEAIEHSPADQVIILPNNENIFLAAQQAAEVSHKHVAVVPTRTIPQGVAALLALDQQMTLDDNVAVMLQNTKDVITGEVTWATRDVKINGVDVREGDAIGLLDGELVVDSRSFDEAVFWLLAEVELEDRELVTVYYGEGVEAPQVQELVDRLSDNYPELEFEVVEGGQPHYPYIISIE
ncbi:MAG TPA: DAK2 domain-containing protein [Anaerolineae bacterium]|nr:DAK2 domain-containing protein [Anaerolineae bacterium]HQH37747.1 DAK2 domain-containing protein [Anaerolineae bacterium]